MYQFSAVVFNYLSLFPHCRISIELHLFILEGSKSVAETLNRSFGVQAKVYIFLFCAACCVLLLYQVPRCHGGKNE